ncbi:hypothetical protein C8R45DRAFT_944583 [Mycena sanguinolenta]|nr:hypothetical protein C8R45DRAFT_944583 [Mycena sanguinolenta]
MPSLAGKLSWIDQLHSSPIPAGDSWGVFCLMALWRCTPSKSKHKPPPPPPALSYPYPSEPGTPVGEFGQQQAFFSQRPRSLSQGQQALAAGEGGYGAVGFLPTTVPVDINVPCASTSSSSAAAPSAGVSTANLLFGSGGSASASAGRAAYGLLSPARDTVLGLPDVARLVAVLCAELERTGIAVYSRLVIYLLLDIFENGNGTGNGGEDNLDSRGEGCGRQASLHASGWAR